MEINQKNLTVLPASALYTSNGSSGSGIPWGAIWAGVIVSLGVQVLLNFLGVGLGLFTLNHVAANQLKIAETNWLLLSSVIAMISGGWFVGTFSKNPAMMLNTCYGIIAWCIVVLVAVFATNNLSGVPISGVSPLSDNNIIIQPGAETTLSTSYFPSFQHGVAGGASEKEIAEDQLRQAAKHMGKTSLLLFCNFLVGCFASALGAVLGGRFPIDSQKRR